MKMFRKAFVKYLQLYLNSPSFRCNETSFILLLLLLLIIIIISSNIHYHTRLITDKAIKLAICFSCRTRNMSNLLVHLLIIIVLISISIAIDSVHHHHSGNILLKCNYVAFPIYGTPPPLTLLW